MKKIIFLIFFGFNLCYVSAQQAVHFSASAEKKASGTYVIMVKATLAKGWHVYAQTGVQSGVDAPVINFDNENIEKQNGPELTGKISEIKDPVFDNKQTKVFAGDLALMQTMLVHGAIPASINIVLNCFASDGKEFLPVEEKINVALEGGIIATTDPIKIANADLSKPVSTCGSSTAEANNSGSAWTLFILGFAGGLIALLTPCVFPMIPVTVSFFTGKAATKKQGVRNGILYGFFIVLIYVAASLPFHLIGNINPQILNSISTNTWVNLAFFLIFVVFALSFFGLFEITLPSAIANSAGAGSNITSVAGIFFMALTLAAVSFSCTGPILGTLLVGSLSGSSGAWQLTTGLAAFGCALALPFALFAIFPGWLSSLPKSGGWMDTVKKVLAFVELALALKFLSNADLVGHWGILKPEVFIGLWLLIALSLSIYLLMYAKKRVAGIIALAFAVYLTPGLTNTSKANLKLLSGFPPPMRYSIYSSNQKKGTEPDVINDYEKALALSKQTGKPLLIDFTGWACVNCRKMEEQVWTNPEVQTIIKEKFILVSLYVDDRKKLNEPINYKDRELKTIGDRFAAMESGNFGQVTQPLYVILDSNEHLMNRPVGYTPAATEYASWLNCGLQAANNNTTRNKQ